MLRDISMITVYLTLDRSVIADGVGQSAEKIKNLDSKLFIYTIYGIFYS
jgi:hypothetical protein